MNTDDLIRFVTVVDLGSFTTAAQNLGDSQATLSRSIQRIEREMEAVLLDRLPGGVGLTPSGTAVYRFAKSLGDDMKRTLSEIRGTALPLAGELRIAASTTPGESILPELIMRFVSTWPGVRPKLFVADSRVVAHEVSEGRWDLGFTGARYPARSLIFDPFTEDEIVLAASIGNFETEDGFIALRDLADQRFITRAEGSGTAKSVEELLADRGLTLPPAKTVFVANNTRALLATVAAGHGVAWVSERSVVGTRLRVVRLRGLTLKRHLYIVRRRSAPLSAAAAAFQELVRVADARGRLSGGLEERTGSRVAPVS